MSHVWARGNNRQVIFRADWDRYRYLQLLKETVIDFRWRCLAYCLMGNHVHLMVETTEANLGEGMKWLHGRFAQVVNQRYFNSGHLFGDRFGWRPQATAEQLKHTARYIALNPVGAGLCQYPEDWAWSSHRLIVVGAAPPWLARDRLLEFFSAHGGDPLERYARFVAQGRSDALRMAA